MCVGVCSRELVFILKCVHNNYLHACVRAREAVVVGSASTAMLAGWKVHRNRHADTDAHTNVIAQISPLKCSDAANVVITYGWLITRWEYERTRFVQQLCCHVHLGIECPQITVHK